MTKEDFVELVLHLDESQTQESLWLEMGINAGKITEPLYQIIEGFLERNYKEAGIDVFNWWVWENRFGRMGKKYMKEFSSPIDCVEELYYYLETKRL